MARGLHEHLLDSSGIGVGRGQSGPLAFLSTDGLAQTTHPIADSVSVVGVVSATDNGGSPILQTDGSGNILNDNETVVPPGPFTGVAGPGPVLDVVAGAADFSIDYQFLIRERANTSQLNRTAYSFLSFDVSSLTLADVNNSGFVAEFSVDYVGALNNLNGPGQYALGTVNTAWDSTANFPTTLDGEAATLIAGSTLVANSIDMPPAPGTTLTVDITSAVRGWVDGSIPNNGLTIIETDGMVNIGDDVAGPTTNQSGYFSNAVLTTDLFNTTLKGDVNMDQVVNFFDIAPFIEVLSVNGFQLEADVDCNNAVDFFDIGPFIGILAGP